MNEYNSLQDTITPNIAPFEVEFNEMEEVLRSIDRKTEKFQTPMAEKSSNVNSVCSPCSPFKERFDKILELANRINSNLRF
jgi:hypothetical protein